MKLKKLFPVLLAAASLTATAQVENRLSFSPEFPKAGEATTLIYTPLPSMTGNKSIHGVAYTFVNGKWIGHDITVDNEGSVWKGSFTPEPETGFMAFKFVADTIVDNNGGMTFATMINKTDGRPWPGGYAAWGLLRSQKYNRSIPGYIDFSKTPEVNDTIVYYWINNEISYNPESAVEYAPLFARAARAANIEGAEKRISNAVEFLKQNGSEKALMNAMQIVSSDSAATASLRKLIIEKYPEGLLAMQERYTRRFDYRKPENVRNHYAGFLKEFPFTTERDEYLAQYGHNYDDIRCTLMILDWMENKTDSLIDKVDDLSFYACNAAFYKIITISHIRKEKTPQELLPLATKIVDRMQMLKTVKPAAFSYLSDSEWESEANATINGFVAETYSEILKEAGDIGKALEYSRLAQSEANYMRAEINDNMAELLKASGKTAELKELLEKSQYNNQVSPMQTEMIREIYISEHNGSADGFEAYVEQLKNPAEKTAIQKEVEGYRREGTMPQWSLTDADGKTVSSELLKGKVYVIDFWANWCHPCKASLPGMKLAADHFKDDPNVEFLFVDTQEYIPDYKEKAKNYLKEKELDIHLVFDGPREGSEVNDQLSSQIMEQFRSSGIPLKIVVDGEGKIRFLAVGYKGSPSALRDEMIEMVGQAKKSQDK